MRIRLKARASLALIAIIATIIMIHPLYAHALDPQRQFIFEKNYIIIRKADYYGGAEAAFLLIIDNYLPFNLIQFNSNYINLININGEATKITCNYNNYQNILIKFGENITNQYPWLKLTIINYLYCSDYSMEERIPSEFNSFVEKYEWEIINIWSQDVYSKYSNNYLNYNRFDKISNLMSCSGGITSPLYNKVENYINFDDFISIFDIEKDNFHFCKILLNLFLKKAIVNNDAMIVRVPMEPYYWYNQSYIIKIIDYIVEMLSGENVWVATLGELDAYRSVYEASDISYYTQDGSLIIEVSTRAGAGEVERVPLTILIYHNNLSIKNIMVNGRVLPQVESSLPISRISEGYMIEENYVAVNIYPPAKIIINFEENNYYIISASAIETERTLETARLLSLILWAPVIGKVILAYNSHVKVKRGKAERNETRALDPRKVKYAVFIPARNASETITDTIASILRQTIAPSVIVIVDDNSTDDTVETVTAFILSLGGELLEVGLINDYDKLVYEVDGVRIYVLRSKYHRGKAYNINRAVEILSNDLKFDYIMIVDSDTIVEPEAAENMLARLEEDPRVALATGLILLWRPDSRSRLAWVLAGAFRNLGGAILSLGLRFLESLSGSLGSSNGAIMIIRSSVFNQLGGLPESTLAEDTVFTWRLQLEGYRAVFVRDAIAYTIDPGRLARIASKTARISSGLIEGAVSLLPKAIMRRRFLLAATIAYNAFGGLPLTLAVAHLVVTSVLLAVGAYEATSVYRITMLFPSTIIQFVIINLLKDPLIYIVVFYAITMIEILIILNIIIMLNKDNSKIVSSVKRSLKYVPVLPFLLWINAVVSLGGGPYALYRRIMGRKAKW